MFALWQDQMRRGLSENKMRGSEKALLRMLKALSEEVRIALDSGRIVPEKRAHARDLLVQTYLLVTSEEKFDIVRAKRLARDLDNILCGDQVGFVPGKRFKVITEVSSDFLKHPLEQRVSRFETLETHLMKLSKTTEAMLTRAMAKEGLRVSNMADNTPDMEIVFEGERREE
jgi:hypothetical protein